MTCMGADSVDSRVHTWAVFAAKIGSRNLHGKGDTALGRRAGAQELVMLGERIRSRRIKLCLSQEELAEKAGISANTVSRIEGGQMSMGIGTFIKLVQAMDADANDLLGIAPGLEKKQYQDILRRIIHLRAEEQEIVMRTVETLAESLRQGR